MIRLLPARVIHQTKQLLPTHSPTQRVRGGFSLLILLLLSGLLWQSALAVTPPNDLCSGAEVIPTSGPFPYYSAITLDVSTATTVGDPPAPGCVVGGTSRSIWYRFTPGASGLYTLSCSDDTATTVPDTVMALYTSANDCNGPFLQVGCNDDAGGLKSAVSTILSATTNYFIVVWVAATSPPLTAGHAAVQLKVSRLTPPANDSCAEAEVIPGSGPFPHLTTVSDNSLATSAGDPPAPLCQASVSRSVWYQFTPSVTATYTLSTGSETATTVYDTVMAIYTSAGGCGGAFSMVACNDNSLGFRAAITTTLKAGETYSILVWEAGNDPYIPGETSVQLRVSGFFAPTVTALPVTGITSTGAVLHATVNPNGVATTAWFDWGTTTNYTHATALQSLGNGYLPLTLTAALDGPLTNRTYYFRVCATNVLGSNWSTNLNFTWVATRPIIQPVIRPANNTFGLQFAGASGQIYLVQSSTNLLNWATLGTATNLGNGWLEFVDPNSTRLPIQSYRIFVP